jgi:hypothetical protein
MGIIHKLAKGRKSKKVVRQLICDCEKTSQPKLQVPLEHNISWGKNCQCYQDGVGKFKALNTFIHKV